MTIIAIRSISKEMKQVFTIIVLTTFQVHKNEEKDQLSQRIFCLGFPQNNIDTDKFILEKPPTQVLTMVRNNKLLSSLFQNCLCGWIKVRHCRSTLKKYSMSLRTIIKSYPTDFNDAKFDRAGIWYVYTSKSEKSPAWYRWQCSILSYFDEIPFQ